MNIGVHVSFQIAVFIFFGYIPRSGIAGSNGSSIFSVLRNLHTIFHCGCINLHSHQQWVHEGSLFSTSSSIFVICGLFDNSHSDRCEVIPHCDLNCISLMISIIEHLFMCLLAICMSLGKYLFRSSAHFLIGFFAFLILSCMTCLYILDINPY